MAKDTLSQMIESISAAVTLTSSNTGATGEEIMEALAIVSMTSHALFAADVKNIAVAGMFDCISMEMQPDEV